MSEHMILSVPDVQGSRKAPENNILYVESLHKRPEFLQGKPHKFNRDELYEESRWVKQKR